MAKDARPSAEGYEEVRRRLVERGYLRGPIERFVLRDVVGGRALTLLRTASKAAMLGAPVLGAFLAGTAVAVNRPLLGAADAILLWVYFGLASLPPLLALDVFAAGVASIGVGGKGRAAGRRVAVLVAVGVVAYLATLWARRDPGLGTIADAAFVVGAVVTTSVVAWLARLVSLVAVFRRTGDVPARGRRGVVGILAVSAVAAIVFVALPRTAAGRGAAGEPASPFDPPADPVRTVLLGIDGLDAGLIAGLEPTGAVDPLLEVFASGAVLPVAWTPGLSPPAAWTSLTTGTGVALHGVADVETERLPGVSTPLRTGAGPVPLAAALRFLLPTRPAPVSGASRRVRNLWEIVGLHRPTAAVGWWASWPAQRPKAGGYVVTDRVLAKLLSGAPPDRDTAPGSLFDRLRGEFESDRSRARADFESRFDAVPGGRVRDLAWESFLIDDHALAAGDLVGSDPEVALVAIYLPGLDILRERIGRAPAGTVDVVAAGSAFEAYVGWLVGRVSSLGANGRRLVLIGDPGRAGAAGDEGFLAVAGPGARRACVADRIDPLQVAPTVLRALGEPRSEEMRSAGGTSCWTGPAPVPAVVPTFGRRPVATLAAPGRDDAELLERLRSLGYVE